MVDEEQSIVNGLHLAPSIEWYATLKEQSIVNVCTQRYWVLLLSSFTTVAYCIFRPSTIKKYKWVY